MLLIVLALACNGAHTTDPPSTPADEAGPTTSVEAPAPEATETTPADAEPEAPVPETTAGTPADAEPTAISAKPTPVPAGKEVYGASYNVTTDPTLDGRTLSLGVRHGGGCAEHTWALKPAPRSAAAPSTLVVHLSHDANGDTCRRLLNTEVSLPLEDVLGAECTESIELHTFPVEGKSSTWSLDLTPAHGC